jgi:hypothetical protein
MIDLNNYKNKLDELKRVHKYVSNKLIMLYILFGLCQVLFLGVIVFHSIVSPENLEKFFPLAIYLALYLSSFFLFIPIIKYNNGFTKGQLTEFVYNVVLNELGISFEQVYDKKEINNFVKEYSNILSFNSLSTHMCINLYDETRQNIIARYAYVSITYNKYLSYNGYLIIIPSKLATNDSKYFTKSFTSFSIDYKKDKENSDDLTHIYYNKKTDYVFDQNLVDLHKYIDGYYNEYLSNKMSIGLLSKNNHLSIMFANNPKVHPNFTFKHKMTDEYLEKLINSIVKDIELIKKIHNR